MKNYFSDQRTITFLISLLIAFGLWLLIKLSGDFQTENKVQLDFQNFPIDKILINKPVSILQIKTHNNGFDALSQFLFTRHKSLNINFNTAKFLKIRSGVSTYYILASRLQQNIEEKFKTANQILSIRPDSIVFKFEKLASKKIKIVPQFDISFNPRFKQYKKLEMEPDSLLVFGPASLLHPIDSINTQVLELHDISSNIDTLIHTILINNNLVTQNKGVRVKLFVEEYTENKIKLPISLNANSEIQYKIFPSEATITYQVALIDYTKINPNAFELLATPDTIDLGKLNLKLSKQPKNVIVSNIQPASAEYIILK